MPAVSGTMEFVETSIITNTATGVLGTVAELRGVPTAALTTGDLAYISVNPQNNSHYYILIKESITADNGGTVIATKESLLGAVPGTTPGRWFQSNITTLAAP